MTLPTSRSTRNSMSSEQPSLPPPHVLALRGQNNLPMRSAWGLGPHALWCFQPPVLYQGPGGWRRRCGRTPCPSVSGTPGPGWGWGEPPVSPEEAVHSPWPLTFRTPSGRAGNMEADAAGAWTPSQGNVGERENFPGSLGWEQPGRGRGGTARWPLSHRWPSRAGALHCAIQQSPVPRG